MKNKTENQKEHSYTDWIQSSFKMSDSFPIPGAWDTMWESPSPAPAPAPPVHTTIGSEILAPVQEAQSRTSTIPTPTPTTQRRTDSIYQGPQLRGPPPPPPPRPPTEIFIPRPTHVPRSRTEDTGMSTDVVEENKPIVIAVFGQTGTGKTSFIKAATGEDLQIGHSLTSCETHHIVLRIKILGSLLGLKQAPNMLKLYHA